MDKRKITIFLMVILFIFLSIINEIKNVSEKKEKAVTGTEAEETTEFEEGDIELEGEPNSDYLLEEFTLSFSSDDLQETFEQNGRIDYLKYSLYQYLYDNQMGDMESAVVLEEYRDTGTRIFFVIELERIGSDTDIKYLNGVYQVQEDLFTFEDVMNTPGRTNDYVEIEESEGESK